MCQLEAEQGHAKENIANRRIHFYEFYSQCFTSEIDEEV